MWNTLGGRITKVLDSYIIDFVFPETLEMLKEEDLAADDQHQAFVSARTAWEISKLSSADRFEKRELWATARVEDAVKKG